MRILVTGATGFLGSHLVDRLLKEGLQVSAHGRNQTILEGLSQKGAVALRGDLSEKDFVGELSKDFDVVVHCAALSSPWGRIEDFYKCNVAATKNLIDHFKETSLKRFVHISSPSLYVDTVDRFNITEDEPLPPVELNHYIATKRMAEKEVDQSVTQGFPAITLRPQGIVGPGDRSIFPRILRTARKGFVPRIGGGSTRIDLTYVENVVEAIVLALQAPSDLHGKKYNITNDEPVDLYSTIAELMRALNIDFRWKDLSFRKAYTIAQVMEWSCRHLFRNTEPLLTRYSVCVLGVSRTLDVSAAKKDLGYKPQVNMAEAMVNVVEGLKNER